MIYYIEPMVTFITRVKIIPLNSSAKIAGLGKFLSRENFRLYSTILLTLVFFLESLV